VEIWIWQGIISPHMMGLAVALTKRGCEVTYVAESEMREDRRRSGGRSATPGMSAPISHLRGCDARPCSLCTKRCCAHLFRFSRQRRGGIGSSMLRVTRCSALDSYGDGQRCGAEGCAATW